MKIPNNAKITISHGNQKANERLFYEKKFHSTDSDTDNKLDETRKMNKRKNFEESVMKKENYSSPDNCPICFEPLTKCIILKQCKHALHAQCFLSCWDNNIHNCPLCHNKWK
jgi:Zinc finger, C3HC4 type (RING finger)